MLHLPLLLTLFALLSSPVFADTPRPPENPGTGQDKSAPATLELAKAAYLQGEWKRARSLFLQALRENPEEAETVRKYLALVKAGERSGIKPVDLRARMANAKIDTIEFKDLPARAAVLLLQQKVAAKYQEKFEPNFVFKDADLTTLVSLSLADIPASEVLRYIMELTGNQAVYDTHAIVISRAARAKTGEASPGAKP